MACEFFNIFVSLFIEIRKYVKEMTKIRTKEAEHGCMAVGGHGLPKVSPRPAMSYPLPYALWLGHP
jgi:hypothetical protein